MFMIVCTICGYITPTILETLAPALLPSRRYAIIAATALLVPGLVYLIGGLGFGTYTGSVGTILAFIGVGALYGFIIGLGTRLLQALIGPLAIFISLAIFVFLNIASLGATYTSPVLAASGASSTTSGSEHKPSTHSAASSTSEDKESPPTCSDCSPGQR